MESSAGLSFWVSFAAACGELYFFTVTAKVGTSREALGADVSNTARRGARGVEVRPTLVLNMNASGARPFHTKTSENPYARAV